MKSAARARRGLAHHAVAGLLGGLLAEHARLDRAGDLAEPDLDTAAAAGPGGDGDRVAVLQEAAGEPSPSCSGRVPFQLISMNEPRWSASGPEIVPEAKKSPARSEAPLMVMWVSICSGDQYIRAYGGRDTTSPFRRTSRDTSRPRSAAPRRYGSGGGSRGGGGIRASSNASNGTTHGETDVAKLLPR